MEEGEVVLIVFPQDAEKKLRPALILREFPKYGDVLICGISSRLQQFIPEFDILLDERHLDFEKSGLKAPAVCRLNMLTMMRKQDIKGTLGLVSSHTHFRLLKNLSEYLVKEQ